MIAPGLVQPADLAAAGLAHWSVRTISGTSGRRWWSAIIRLFVTCRVDLPLVHGPMDQHSWHFFWLVLGPEARVDRNAFIEGLIAREVGFSVHYKPLHHMTYYKERYGLTAEGFPQAERHWRGCVSLPLYPSMTDEEVSYVIRTVQELLG